MSLLECQISVLPQSFNTLVRYHMKVITVTSLTLPPFHISSGQITSTDGRTAGSCWKTTPWATTNHRTRLSTAAGALSASARLSLLWVQLKILTHFPLLRRCFVDHKAPERIQERFGSSWMWLTLAKHLPLRRKKRKEKGLHELLLVVQEGRRGNVTIASENMWYQFQPQVSWEVR